MEGEMSEQRVVISGVPRGGPIYLQNTVGNLSSIPEFQSSFLNLLQDLETHLSLESPSSSQQYDVSTDALKIYTEEELTSMAMKEAFPEEDDNLPQNQLEQSLIVSPLENLSAVSVRTTKRKRSVRRPRASLCNASCSENPSAGSSRTTRRTRTVKTPTVSLCNSTTSASCSENPSAASLRTTKGKRTVKTPGASLCNKDDYLAKVEQLAKIKQKQDEDKSAARLHCFSKTVENGKDVGTSTEGLEQMQSLKYIDDYTPVKPSDIQGQAGALYPEVILCIEIYNSCKRKTQEILVLGRQMLTELKDKIHCRTDQVMEKAGTYDHSGYFLIEDVFYNDLRNPSAIDYSKPILDWLWNSKDEALEKWQRILTGELKRNQKAALGEMKSMDLPRFGSAHMQSTRFCDLRFRLGANYIYCHQGDCKHRVVIRDMRMSHPEDVKNRAAYPRLVYQKKVIYQKCSICKIYRATKFAVDVKWAIENPCYFCDICFTELGLDEDSVSCGFPIYDYVYE